MAIRATDNEQYATELWGDNKRWDEDRKQFVPTEAGEAKVDQVVPERAEEQPGDVRSPADPNPSVTTGNGSDVDDNGRSDRTPDTDTPDVKESDEDTDGQSDVDSPTPLSPPFGSARRSI